MQRNHPWPNARLPTCLKSSCSKQNSDNGASEPVSVILELLSAHQHVQIIHAKKSSLTQRSQAGSQTSHQDISWRSTHKKRNMPSMILVSDTPPSGSRTSKDQKVPNKEVSSVPVPKPIWVSENFVPKIWPISNGENYDHLLVSFNISDCYEKKTHDE